jgi:hypothetical protein
MKLPRARLSTLLFVVAIVALLIVVVIQQVDRTDAVADRANEASDLRRIEKQGATDRDHPRVAGPFRAAIKVRP